MKIIDSVAAVFCHEHHLFAVRRQAHLDAFPGYDSFPGGKVDRTDPEEPRTEPMLQGLDGKQAHALIREMQEELQFDLPTEIASGRVTHVVPMAKALAPALVPVRFRLHFFRINLQERPPFVPDSGEFAETFWKTPQELLNQFRSGNSMMVPPMRWVLEALERTPDAEDLGDLSPQYDEELHVPKLETISEVRMLAVPSNTVPPATRTNAFLLGDEDAPRVLLDPSPASSEVLEKLLRTLENERVDRIFLTHHHPDHHEFAPELALRLQVPISLSAQTHRFILEKHGPDYFSPEVPGSPPQPCIPLEFVEEGDILTRWKGEPVRVHAVPGHDAGQLALAPDSLRWFIVGDLIQGIGTVVIGEPEGDMATYFQTLEKVIALAPEVIIPSHGMPMRSTFRLQATLQHRREREEAICELTRSGKSEEEVLHVLYQGVDSRLFPFALKNIRSHLKKLRAEGRL